MTQEVERLTALLEKQRGVISEETERLKALADAVHEGAIERIAAVAREVAGPLLELEEVKAKQVAQALQLTAIIGEREEGEPAQPVEPTAIARQFRSVVDKLHLEAREEPVGELATTLKSMDVEIKGLIVVAEGRAAIMTPTPQRQIDPGQLSTIRMSFATFPVVREQRAEGGDVE